LNDWRVDGVDAAWVEVGFTNLQPSAGTDVLFFRVDVGLSLLTIVSLCE